VSAQYFAGRYPDAKLEKLVVTGAPLSLPELGPFFANSVGCRWNRKRLGQCFVSSGLQDKLMGLSSEYATVVGLMRGLIDEYIS
jgi:hypothetical protein